MGLESATYVSELTSSNPIASDNASQGDDHIRLVKAVLQNTFPNGERAFRFPFTVFKTANFSITSPTDENEIYGVDATAGNITVTLPSSPTESFAFRLYKIDGTANTITLDPSGSDTINGAATFVVSKLFQAVFVVWTSSHWTVFQSFNVTPYYSGGQDIPFTDIAPSGAAKRVLAATTATDWSEHTVAAILEFLSASMARGDLLMRGASAFDRLGAGDATKVLTANGAAADLTWEYPRMPARAYGEYGTNTALTGIIPADNTIPQVGEGDEIISVTITTQTDTSRVRLSFQGSFALGTGGATGTVAFFRDGAANSIAATGVNHSISGAADGVNHPHPLVLEFEEAPGNAGTYTYSVRTGSNSGGYRLNGLTSGALYGGVMKCTLTVQEIFMP